MKKLLALLTLAALLMTAFVCPTLAESPMTGGWSAYTDDPTEIPAEALDALNAALEELVGCVYKPIALLAYPIKNSSAPNSIVLDLFGGSGSSENMPATQLPEARFTDGKIGAIELLVACGLCASNGEARRLIQQGGVAVNDQKVASIDVTFDQAQFAGDGVVIKKGKKVFHRAYTA